MDSKHIHPGTALLLLAVLFPVQAPAVAEPSACAAATVRETAQAPAAARQHVARTGGDLLAAADGIREQRQQLRREQRQGVAPPARPDDSQWQKKERARRQYEDQRRYDRLRQGQQHRLPRPRIQRDGIWRPGRP
ncbi:hypothetical protein [uncultured Desulfovibrio sp.]|uniref:hypothetical protein n=1 Tax=uncultured Desulfovibrio sp. TaxID=167968 RepID=UPI00260764DC|nr:hypothetical protein [uncultured Desulfovibrio sp.]